MILAGQTSSADQANALQGNFAFSKNGDHYKLNIMQLQFDVIKDTTMTISYISPIRNGQIPQPEPIFAVSK